MGKKKLGLRKWFAFLNKWLKHNYKWFRIGY